MWRIVFLYICVCASANNDFPTFRKCCPEGQNLIKVMNPDVVNLEDSYECLDSAFETVYNITNPKPTLFVSEGVTVEYGMPMECDFEMIPYDGNIQLSESSNYCYDRLVVEIINGTVKKVIPKTIALVCNGTELNNESSVKVINIRKCCPPGQTYDTEFHMCRRGGEGYDERWLIEKLQAFSGVVYEFDDGLQCKSAEYAVELREEKFFVVLLERRLDISNRNREGGGGQSPQGNWCVDREYNSRGLVARVCTEDCSRFDALCVRKCCPVGQHYLPFHCGTLAGRCVPNKDDKVLYDLSDYVHRTKSKYGVGDIMGLRSDIQCKSGKISLNRSYPSDWHHLTRNGDMESALGVRSDYCLEVFDTSFCGVDPYVSAVTCFIKEALIKDFRLSFVLNSLSAVCLALTLIVYCAIPELRNLHGRNLICHVSMMLLAYSCLARAQYEFVSNRTLCTVLGYGIYFGFVSAFAWLNVMCADIWWTFGSVRTVNPLQKGSAGRRRFCWYSLYAWSVSVSLTLIMFLFDKFPVADVLDANMGMYRCWFAADQNAESDWPHYIFFVIPLGLVSCSNFVLWVLTARHCSRVKSEVHRLQAGSVGDRVRRRFRIDKANFVLTGKLWVVMGAGWCSELLSTLAFNPDQWIWTIVDMVNELQGVFIFIILIFKPKLYYLIRKRLGLEKPDAQKNGTSSTARTSSTFLSRTISSDERAHARVSLPNNNAKQL
ncbi:probable G-protein coupled receptor Mth-like 3 isoform X2 [Ostrinia nubilalis]|uniref:probable G-protein coupled receptor Mth-like 3 isoform X2 n=1 Tax=Ostrinia nubilalis TaxID=29057 RepID=UPI0030822497